MIARTLTSRDFLRICSREILGGQESLSPEDRWQQAVSAKSMRNFWFTATANPLNNNTGADALLGADTPRFAEPIIVTDVLSMFDFKSEDPLTSAMMSRYFLQLTRYGSHDATSGVDLFGLPGLVGQEMITKHEKNYSQAISISLAGTAHDTQPKYLPFVPRILEPYDFIQARWTLNAAIISDPLRVGYYPQIGFRSVRVLQNTNPYRYILQPVEKRIRNYINGNHPETFLMQVEFPLADVTGAQPGDFSIKTPQQGRPLLVLGAASNLEGAQASLSENSGFYEFTAIDRPIRFDPRVPTYTYVPLSLWAANSDFRNTNIYNMWPVPHLLEPDAQLEIQIVDGIYPNRSSSSFQVPIATRGSQNVRITFVCRTV